MNFLYPGFLFALLAVAVPVIIHLFNFRRFKKVYFSNVQFLKELQEQNASRERLKNLLILLCRCLALAFLVLAFARPFLPAENGERLAMNRTVSIYIDNSYSMETVNKEGSLLDEAKRKAKEIVSAYTLSDRFQLLTNDFEGRHQRQVNREEFLTLLDEVKISSASRSLQQVLNRLKTGLDAGTEQVVYLISDFQRGFAGNRLDPSVLSGDVDYHVLRLNANNQPNIAADSIWSLSPVHKPGETSRFVVRLRNYGEEDAEGIPLKLMVNGQQKALSNVKVPAGKPVMDTLSVSGLGAGWQKATVAVRDYPLTFDDELNFTFEVSPSLDILNISGPDQGSYIHALFKADNYFKLTEMPESNIRYAGFSRYDLIVLNGLKEPSSGLAQELETYVQNGGTVVIFPNLDTDVKIYSSFLTGLKLPVVQQLLSGQPVPAEIDLKDPMFRDVFDQVPDHVDLPVAMRYFSYADASGSGRENLLKLPLNRSMFARYGRGSGNFYLSAVGLDPKDASLSRHPVFVPLMYKVAFGSGKGRPLSYTAGRDELIETQKVNLLGNEVLRLVSGSSEVIPELRQLPGKTRLYVADQIRKGGFYDLKKQDSLLAIVAFNEDRRESDMHYAGESDLKGLFGKVKAEVYNSRRDALSLNMAAKNNPAELWKLCLILAVVFLSAEVLLIRFFNPTKNLQGT